MAQEADIKVRGLSSRYDRHEPVPVVHVLAVLAVGDKPPWITLAVGSHKIDTYAHTRK